MAARAVAARDQDYLALHPAVLRNRKFSVTNASYDVRIPSFKGVCGEKANTDLPGSTAWRLFPDFGILAAESSAKEQLDAAGDADY
jgi:hypothetical protein